MNLSFRFDGLLEPPFRRTVIAYFDATRRIRRLFPILLHLTESATVKQVPDLNAPALCLGRELSKHSAFQKAVPKTNGLSLAFSLKVIGMTIALPIFGVQ